MNTNPIGSNSTLHMMLFHPYLEGCERMNLAWNGIHPLRSIGGTPLSLKERTVECLTGLSLMIPLLNTLIWVFWDTFGSPDQLADLPPG